MGQANQLESTTPPHCVWVRIATPWKFLAWDTHKIWAQNGVPMHFHPSCPPNKKKINKTNDIMLAPSLPLPHTHTHTQNSRKAVALAVRIRECNVKTKLDTESESIKHS